MHRREASGVLRRAVVLALALVLPAGAHAVQRLGRAVVPTFQAIERRWISKHRGAKPAEVRQALVAAGNFNWDDRDDPDNMKEPLVDVSSF